MIKEKVRYLRKNQTNAEQLLWACVRNRQLSNHKFLRQYPVRFKIDNTPRIFIADFYCAQGRLIVELDGAIHEKQIDYDNIRTEKLVSLGYTVIRFTNAEVINSIVSVLEKINKELLKSPLCRREAR